ncbi:MAG: hypothetical protein SPL42_07200 [Bacteroidales bacterium]|nr:hypothetical protein [Bacteroidales bacterium]MDY6348194.1 hypothetical protein [Bacteroidales bacterium]
MMDINNTGDTENRPRRTVVLWILAVLTMLNTGFSAITYTALALNPGIMEQSFESVRKTGMFPDDKVEQMAAVYASVESWQYFLLAVVQAVIFSGAFIMLSRLNRIGLHFYVIGQILQFCVLNFVIGGQVAMDINAVITAILWVLMYSTQLRFMQKEEK